MRRGRLRFPQAEQHGPLRRYDNATRPASEVRDVLPPDRRRQHRRRLGGRRSLAALQRRERAAPVRSRLVEREERRLLAVLLERDVELREPALRSGDADFDRSRHADEFRRLENFDRRTRHVSRVDVDTGARDDDRHQKGEKKTHVLIIADTRREA